MDIGALRQKAESGSVAAQCLLGICYLDGVDVDVDYDAASRLLSAATAKGSPQAMAALARMYAGGLGVTKNLPKAVRLYEVAAGAGESDAQIELARLQATTEGQRPSD